MAYNPKKEDENKPYSSLASAIVKQALNDYRMACKIKASGRYENDAKTIYKINKTIAECERFFNSEWAELLTDADLSTVAKGIREKVGLE